MVHIAPFVGAAVFLSGLVSGAPSSQYGSSASSYGSSDSGSSYGSSGYGQSSDSQSSNSYGSSSNYGSSNSGYGSSGSSESSYGSGYGSSSSDSSYGSSNSGYGSGSSYGSGSNYGSSDSSSLDNSYDTTSTAYVSYETSSVLDESTSTSTAYVSSYTSPSYGSGSSNWGGSGYNDCVQQCIASFGAPAATYQATATSGSYGSSGTGATITVIVAPTQGVLRFVPFAVNASVGDTIEFHWGANNHTVTKSSELTPCNKSAEPLFASGEHNKDFVFTQVVNDTSPTFFYCGTPTHCQKGMFGIINPPNALDAPTSFSGSIQSMASNNSDISAYVAYSNSVVSQNSSSVAQTWGGSIDLAGLPDWAHSFAAENILFTRNLIAMNSDIVGADGSIDLSSVATTPLMLPNDISAALNAASAPSSTSSAVSSETSSAVSDASGAAAAATSAVSNGASSLASPRILVGLMVIIATFFAL